jgi:ribonuclease P protein component
MTTASTQFTRVQRLLKADQFKHVFNSGIRRHDKFFTVIAARQQAEEYPVSACRLGLAISRKAAARATDRNRIKRIVRESFRLANPRWDNTNIDLVVMAKRGSTGARNARLFHSLQAHWQRIQSDPQLAPSLPRCAL